jgi:hypothetical protein
VPLPFICWWLAFPADVDYSIWLPVLVRMTASAADAAAYNAPGLGLDICYYI